MKNYHTKKKKALSLARNASDKANIVYDVIITCENSLRKKKLAIKKIKTIVITLLLKTYVTLKPPLCSRLVAY